MHRLERIPESFDGERLDRVIALVTGLSRSTVADLVDAGAVRLDGETVHTRSVRVQPDQILEIELPEHVESPQIEAEPASLPPVVHEDDDVVVVDKPAGLVVHPGAGTPGGTLVNGLVARYPEIREVGDPERPGIVHRLDRGTSGLMVVARSPRAYAALVDQLAARSVTRRYLALVWGQPGANEGLIDAPIGRSGRNRTRMAIASEGREARTRYRVLDRYDDPVSVALLECTLETGRTHQIRVHLASIGHPVVGDDAYGVDRASLPLDRPWLHAAGLSLDHPVTGERLTFESPLPVELQATLDSLS